jgi:glycosyltransferase involved in cell wall biosynthesis/GT2 family glycosyltransferase
MKTEFPPLPEVQVADGASSPRICIATWEIEGPSRNAGIGTAYTSLADALVRANYDVTVLFLLGYHPTDGNMSEWIRHYRDNKGIKLEPLPMPHTPTIHANWAAGVSYHTYVWLKEHQHNFDIIHFPECQGLGFYSMLAKRQGLAFAKSRFVIGTHGPILWVKEGNQDYLRDLGELEIDHMERTCVAAADAVVSPSQYLLDWMERNNWELPQQTYVAPYIRPYGVTLANPDPAKMNHAVRELVFFGRLELRKGLKLFCDAIDYLCADGENQDFAVSFLGKETQIYGRSSIGYISDRSKKWNVPWRLISNKFQAGAIEYLKGDGRLAVIPSLGDNFPNTVLECVSAGIPVLASNIGGIPEVVAPEDRAEVCFEPRPDVLADRIRDALAGGAISARPSISFADNERRWTDWHRDVPSRTSDQRSASGRLDSDQEPDFPLVSVCFPFITNESKIAATLASLKAQDYPNFEVILVECGSDGPHEKSSSPDSPDLEGINGRKIHQRSREIGAGRNTAALEAKGRYLFFVDDHTLLLPSSALSAFVLVAQKVDVPIVTSSISFFQGASGESPEDRMEDSQRPFLGGDIATGAFANCFGSTNALVRRDAFDAVGGFSDEAISTLDDWEFFVRAAFLGFQIETIPDVFVWYRLDLDQESLVHSIANSMRSVRPYTEPGRKVDAKIEQAISRSLLLGHGMKFDQDALVGKPLSRGEQGPPVTG